MTSRFPGFSGGEKVADQDLIWYHISTKGCVMNYKEDIKPISYIKTHAADMLKRVNENKSPIVITQNGEARAVLIDTESWQNMRSSLGLLKILANGDKAAEDGRLVTQNEVFAQIEERLTSMEMEKNREGEGL
jgi:prevent-host-death family protein